MADWSTVAIAAITATAGIGASVVAGIFSRKNLSTANKRDDAAILRQRAEDLFVALDDAIASANIISSRMANMAAGQKVGDQEPKAIEIARIRAMVALYFPDLQANLDQYDKDMKTLEDSLRGNLEGGKNPAAEIAKFSIELAKLIHHQFNIIRQDLTAESLKIGETIRLSVSDTKKRS